MERGCLASTRRRRRAVARGRPRRRGSVDRSRRSLRRSHDLGRLRQWRRTSVHRSHRRGRWIDSRAGRRRGRAGRRRLRRNRGRGRGRFLFGRGLGRFVASLAGGKGEGGAEHSGCQADQAPSLETQPLLAKRTHALLLLHVPLTRRTRLQHGNSEGWGIVAGFWARLQARRRRRRETHEKNARSLRGIPSARNMQGVEKASMLSYLLS
jgi:hypothetical protein